MNIGLRTAIMTNNSSGFPVVTAPYIQNAEQLKTWVDSLGLEAGTMLVRKGPHTSINFFVHTCFIGSEGKLYSYTRENGAYPYSPNGVVFSLTAAYYAYLDGGEEFYVMTY